MSEKFPGDKKDTHLRVIEGGKRGLKEHERPNTNLTPLEKNLGRVRQLSPALDRYLTQPPADRIERIELLGEVTRELAKLTPSDENSAYNVAARRTREKFGERPVTGEYHWRLRTEEQVAWDGQECLEWANAIGECLAAADEQRAKVRGLEEHLDREAAKFYSDEEAE